MTRLAVAVNVSFLAAVFSVTFTKLESERLGGVSLVDVLTVLFVGLFLADRVRTREPVPRVVWHLAAFGVVLVAIYLAGAVSLEGHSALTQFGKGFARFGLHFALLVCGVALLLDRGRRLYWRALGALCAGIAVSSLYGVGQLVAKRAGVNLDDVLLHRPIGLNKQNLTYKLDAGPLLYRVSGLTLDTNHLGIMLLVPILVLLPLLPLAPPRWRRVLPFLVAGLLLVMLATYSRSALLGLAAGLLVLALGLRRELVSRGAVLAAGLTVVLAAIAVLRDPVFYRRVVESRFELANTGSRLHLHQYDFIGRALDSNPLFGVGLNNFAVHYWPITGKKDYGPLSIYVQSLVETGLVGTAAFACLLGYVALRLRPAPRALAWGLAAALVGTLAANAFYLTITFYYFVVLLMLIAAAPVVAEPEPSGRSLEVVERRPQELAQAVR
jgi:O-antigen ligase